MVLRIGRHFAVPYERIPETLLTAPVSGDAPGPDQATRPKRQRN